jgi:hypothetical protein
MALRKEIRGRGEHTEAADNTKQNTPTFVWLTIYTRYTQNTTNLKAVNIRNVHEEIEKASAEFCRRIRSHHKLITAVLGNLLTYLLRGTTALTGTSRL